jgi:hypothetical protein
MAIARVIGSRRAVSEREISESVEWADLEPPRVVIVGPRGSDHILG